MHIGIIGAMAQEVSQLHSALSSAETRVLHGFTFHSGSLSGHQVTLVESGVGKVAAALVATLLIDNWQPQAVINTGAAGGLDPSMAVLDLVLATELRHHDVDVTAFGFAPGQVFQGPVSYATDPALRKAAEQVLANSDAGWRSGLVCSGDAFVHRPDQVDNIRGQFPATLAVEMEGAAIAQVCHSLAVPCLVIRALSDIAGQDSKVSFEALLTQAADRSAELVRGMLSQLPA